MRIVFISYPFIPENFGGELIISIERFESLVKRGHVVEVFTSGINATPELGGRSPLLIQRSPHVHHSKLGRGLRRLIFPWWAGIRILSSRPDLLHLGGMGGVDPLTNMIGALFILSVAKLTGAKTVWVHSLADSEEKSFTNEGFENWCRSVWLDMVDQIVSVSPALEGGVREYFPFKSVGILNAVRDDLFLPLTPEKLELERSKLGAELGELVILFLGSVTYRKGFDLLANAFLLLNSEFKNLKLWVIGPKSKDENQNLNDFEVLQLTSCLEQVREKVKFFGRIDERSEIVGILGSADFFVFPTRREGLPLAPGEAMASGLPVVISKIPGVTDLMVVEGETGYFFEPGDVEGLTMAIQKLILDSDTRKRMGVAGRKRIVEHFGWEKHIDEWENLYLTLIGKDA